MKRTQDHVIQAHLESGERVLWAGRPVARAVALRWFPSALAGTAVVTLTFFSLFRVPAVHAANDLPVVPAVLAQVEPPILLAAIVLGMLLMSAPFAAHALVKEVVYVVTDRRLLQVRAGRRIRVSKEARYGTFGSPVLRYRSWGTSDVEFFPAPESRSAKACAARLVRFLALSDGRIACERIRDQMQAGRGIRGSREVRDYLELIAQGDRSHEGGWGD